MAFLFSTLRQHQSSSVYPHLHCMFTLLLFTSLHQLIWKRLKKQNIDLTIDSGLAIHCPFASKISVKHDTKFFKIKITMMRNFYFLKSVIRRTTSPPTPPSLPPSSMTSFLTAVGSWGRGGVGSISLLVGKLAEINSFTERYPKNHEGSPSQFPRGRNKGNLHAERGFRRSSLA